MRRHEPASRRRLALQACAGLVAFALGAAMALRWLPEWQARGEAAPRVFQERYLQIAKRAGLQPAPGQPHAVLVARNLEQSGPRALERGPTVLAIGVSHAVRRPEAAGPQTLEIQFFLDGRPLLLEWEDLSASIFQSPDLGAFDRLAATLAPLALAPGESLGRSREGRFSGTAVWRRIEIRGSAPEQCLLVFVSPPQSVSVERAMGRFDEGDGGLGTLVRRGLAEFLIKLVLVLAAGVLFLSLLLRGRIDLVNGAILAVVALLSSNLVQLFKVQAVTWWTVIEVLFAAPARALLIFLVWSAGESLLRAVHPDFTTSLDTLRMGRLGPRGGRALLVGFGAGAALAGLHLGVYALSAILPGVSPAGASLTLPVFSTDGSPVSAGILLAAGTALALALALRFLPARWALPAAALATGYALSPFQLSPFLAELTANAAFAGLLVWICRRHGLTALLAAAVVSLLLPSVLSSALHASWMPASLAITAGLTVAVAVLGAVGLSRSEGVESGSLPAPAFIRRLAEERRLHHEVNLLARMQLGLLPQEMPKVQGYEIAARSVLASEAGGDLYDFVRDEAGRLWISAGDVAGHGYSCAIAQAMVKAGVISLASTEESPSQVLRQLDRVLRGVEFEHSFTSLALVRLDPSTGEAVLANAGHPYPLLIVHRKPEDLVLPGLPLGRGPARDYDDLQFQMPPSSLLVFCSDGLFEALNRSGEAYGFERAREVLRVMAHRPAVEIVDALLNDCRRHRGDEEAPDDVTVVVVKRG